MIPLVLALACVFTAPPEEGLKPRRTFDNALVISVDGLRSDALIAVSSKALPAFARLRRGASTLNARTDPDWTITLPNHTSMMTGRFVEGDAGHAWTKNDDPDAGETLHSKRKSYVAGIFDIAHDRGFETQLFTGKSKFSIYDTSWNAENGAPDETGEDDGRDKLDRFVFELDSVKLVDTLLESLARETAKRRLYFVHFAAPDLTGHAYGWDVSPSSRYMKAVQSVDIELARLLDALENSKLRDTTAIILTADHGGGAPWKSHDQIHMWVDYIIPFLVWTGPSGEPRDLYAINADTRADPSLTQPKRDFGGLMPVRNGDAGNLALSLLGLPPLPRSTIGAKHDLRVFDASR